MARKAKMTLSVRIEKMELYILTSLLSRFNENAAKWTSELNQYLGFWTGKYMKYAGRLGELYLERDLESLNLAGRISLLEQVANSIYSVLFRGKRLNADAGIIQHLDAQFTTVCQALQHLYLERDMERFLTRVPLIDSTIRTGTSDIKFTGPDKLERRNGCRDRDARKSRQRARSAEAEAAKDMRTRGGQNQRKSKAA